MSAPSKDDVYAELRRKNIRPIRVDERIAPIVKRGFKGLRKREWIALAAIVMAAIAFAWVLAFSLETKSTQPTTNRQSQVRIGAHPVCQRLIAGVESVSDKCRKAYGSVDWELLSNYALIEKSSDMSAFQSEIKNARRIVDKAKKEIRQLFLLNYSNIPVNSEDDKVCAQRLYGIAMGEMDQMEERIDGVECALEVLSANRDKWHVVKGCVVWSDKSLEREFSLYLPEQIEGTSRWRKDFGDIPSDDVHLK